MSSSVATVLSPRSGCANLTGKVVKVGTDSYFSGGREQPATRFRHVEPAAALEQSASFSHYCPVKNRIESAS